MELRRGIGIGLGNLEGRVFEVSHADLKTDQHKMEKLMLLASSKKTGSRSFSRVLTAKKDELKRNSFMTLDFSWRLPGSEMNYSNPDTEFLKGSVHNHYSFSQAMKLQAGSTGPCSGSGSCSGLSP